MKAQYWKIISILPLFVTILSNYSWPQTAPERPDPRAPTQIKCPNNVKVSLTNGSLTYSRKDLEIPSIFKNLKIEVTYSTRRSDVDAGFGFGWKLNYEKTYYDKDGHDVIVHCGDIAKKFRWDPVNSQYVPSFLEEYEPDRYKLTNPRKKEVYYFSDPTHRHITATEDFYGNASSFGYKDNKLTTVEDSSGRLLILNYIDSHLSEVVDPNSDPQRTLVFCYDSSNNLKSISDLMEATTEYSYLPEHLLTTITDPLGNDVNIDYVDIFDEKRVERVSTDLSDKSFSYDVDNRETIETNLWNGKNLDTVYKFNESNDIVSILDPLCHGENWVYDEGVITHFDKNQNVTIYTLDGRDNVCAITDALGYTVSYSYNSSNRITLFEDARSNLWIYNYNSLGRLIKITAPSPLNYETRFKYGENNKMVAKMNAKGNTTQYRYDVYGNLFEIENPLEHISKCTYDKVGNILSKTDANGHITVYIYDMCNRILSETLKSDTSEPDQVTFYEYDASGNLLSRTDANGNVTFCRYDGLHRLICKKDSMGTYTACEYDTLNNKILETDANNNVTIFEYDECSRLIKKTDHVGNETIYEYDFTGNKTFETDAKGHRTEFRYDELNRLVSEIGPAPFFFTTEYEYDANGNLIKTTDANKNVAFREYDEINRLVGEMDPLGNEITYTYDPVSNWTETTDAKGKTVTFVCDNANWRIATVNQLGKVSLIKRDRVGNITEETDPNKNTTLYKYDFADRIISKQDPLGGMVEYRYDNLANIVERKDENRNSTFYEYDGRNRITRIIDALGFSTDYVYDGNGNLIKVTDARGFSYNYTYNHFNKIESEEDPNQCITKFFYDPVGNLDACTDANGDTIDYQYNEADRLIIIALTNDDDIIIEYDDVGNIIEMRQGFTREIFGYDELNRLLSSTVDLGKVEKTVRYRYDSVGNTVTIKDPDGGITRFRYDASRRLVLMSNPESQLTSFIYDAANRLKKKENINGTHTLYDYDAANRLVALSHNDSLDVELVGFQYVYDGIGNRIHVSDSANNSTNFIYDSLSQLIRVSGSIGTKSYEYDQVGNRVKTVDYLGNATTYSYDPSNRLICAGNIQYGWDNNGNNSVRESNTEYTYYIYDYENKLVSVRFQDGSTKRYGYYPSGRRMFTTDKTGTKHYFIYNRDNVLLETNDIGETIRRYSSYGVDNWLSVREGGKTDCYHKDGLNSIVAVSNNNQEIVASYQYDEFGAVVSQSGNHDGGYLFTGRRYDADCGDYYYRKRTYDPGVGRFIQKDPIRLVQRENLYLYVENNPINYIDPFGACGNAPNGGDFSGSASGSLNYDSSTGLTAQLTGSFYYQPYYYLNPTYSFSFSFNYSYLSGPSFKFSFDMKF